MKKLMMAVILLSCVFLLGACASNDKADTNAGLNGMKVKEGSLSNVGCTLVIDNNEEQDFWMAHNDYEIQQYIDGEWEDIPFLLDGRECLAIAYYVMPGEHREYEIGWEYEYGVLESGKYRIVEKVYDRGYEKIVDYLYAEFSLL